MAGMWRFHSFILQTKLKSQLELDKIKQRNQKEVDQLERDLEEQREAATRKSRSYESRITELDEELHAALQGKRDAERRMLELRDQAPSRDMGMYLATVWDSIGCVVGLDFGPWL